MVQISSKALLLTVWAAAQEARAALNGHCPPLGPVLPAPRRPSSSAAVKAVLPQIDAYLDARMAEFTAAGVNTSALGVAIRSPHEEGFLYEYHFTPTDLDPRGVKKVDSDTVFRIGSTTKLFPALAILQLKSRGVSWEDPVTKYLPELRILDQEPKAKSLITTLAWDEVTLGALASHMGGVGADMPIDVSGFTLPVSFKELGLPEPSTPAIPGCSGLLRLEPCTREDFFRLFGHRAPVFPTFQTPSYSNIGITILSFVVEAVSGMSFEEYTKKEILAPLGMTHTFQNMPDAALGVIPAGELFWNASLGFDAPAGSYYSSLRDLTTLTTAILNGTILDMVEVRKWLKPVTSTPSPGTLLGRPWEIYRTTNITKDGRLIEVYTKGGDLITYHSTVALVPDYDISMAVVVAGNSGVFTVEVQAAVLQMLLPALEQAGKDDAEVNYAGTYVDEATNSTFTLAVDDEPGLNATNYFVRGADIIASQVNINLLPVMGDPVLTRLRLYPTGLETSTQSAWRGVYDEGSAEELAEEDAKFPWPKWTCTTWGNIDRLVYQLQSLDQFVFDVEEKADGSRVATAVEMPAYQVKLTRK